VATQETALQSLRFNPDGTKMFVLGDANNSVFQYTLSTGFDISTASYDSVSFSVATQETSPRALAFKSDGSKMYVAGNGTSNIYQYSTA
jgi:DNA-binding beta-propeller fold protein YncE